jgi:hypothetical protein
LTGAVERRASRLGRIGVYLAGAFPPVPMTIAIYLTIAGEYFAFEASGRGGRLVYTWRSIAAGAFGVCMLLLLRIYDELKDVEVDRRLAAAGDPKYLARPLVRGLVDVEDLNALRWGLTAVAVALNAPLGAQVFGAFVVTFAIAWASSRWFFWPKMRERLLLAFATHNPLTALLHAYVVVVFAADFGWGALAPGVVVATIAGHQAMAAAWEVARKVRAPADETAYVTYSRVLGFRAAAVVTAGLVLGAAGCWVYVARRGQVSEAYVAALGVAAVVVIFACGRFAGSPTRESANLRPYVEGFTSVATIGLLVGLVVRWGVAR